MLGIETSWVVFLAAGVCAGAWAVWKGMPGLGVAVGAAVAWLSATWLAPVFAGTAVDARIAIVAVLLVVFCLHPTGKFRFPIIWLDVVVIGLLLVGAISDLRFSGFTIGDPLKIYGEFVLPYFAGRFAFMRSGVLRYASPVFVASGIVLCAGVAFESLSGVNLWEWLFAPTDDLVSRSRGLRYDLLYRAAGPTRHPIFLGIVCMLLVPWCVALLARKEPVWQRWLGGAGLAAAFLGVCATVSRGPLLALVASALVAIPIAWPQATKWFLGIGGVVGIVAALSWGQLLAWVESTESSDQVRSRVIEVEGRADVYTGTRNRLWVWEIYAPLVVKGGPLGFGTDAVSSFPPNIPGLPANKKARQLLGIVDNSYLLIGLRYGWIGLGLFMSLLGGTIFTAIQLRRSAGMILYPDGPAFLTAMASILVGVALEMLTVFSSYDFMFWVLFHCGVVAGLASLRKDMVRGTVY
jgi:hypothetical protein